MINAPKVLLISEIKNQEPKISETDFSFLDNDSDKDLFLQFI